MRIRALLLAVAAGGILAPAADWLTDGYDNKRTHWQKDEKIFSTSNVKDTKLLWSIKLDNQPRAVHNLLPVLIAENVDTAGGKKEIVLETGVSDNLYAIDAKNGEMIWKKKLENTWAGAPNAGRGSPLCPGGLTATPVIGPGGGPGKYILYTVSWDGMLHKLDLATGNELELHKFMPPNGKPYALNLFNNIIYSHTAQGCGGNPNMGYTYDLATNKVGTWGPAGGGMWGRSGPAISKNGTMYTGTGDGRWAPEDGVYGNGIVGLKPDPVTKELLLEDYYGPTNAEWLWKRDLDMQVTPIIFDWHGRELMVDASKECRLYLMDTKSIGGDDHRTPLYRTPLLCNEDVDFASSGIWGSLTTWEDSKGTRWVLTPTWGKQHSQFKAPISYGPVKEGAVIAFKVEEKNGKPVLTPAWESRDMWRAEAPVIANGIAFTYGNGEDTSQAYPDVGLDFTAERRIPTSKNAVIYALDAQTGKELWNSGDQIKSFVHWGGLSLANGKVYLGSFDGALYCFGIKK